MREDEIDRLLRAPFDEDLGGIEPGVWTLLAGRERRRRRRRLAALHGLGLGLAVLLGGSIGLALAPAASRPQAELALASRLAPSELLLGGKMIRRFMRLAAIGLLASAMGAWGGAWWTRHQIARDSDLHRLLHDELTLSSGQRQRMTALEQDFTAGRARYDTEMMMADRDLAVAIRTSHQYGPAAQAAVERAHRAMAGLQQLTVRHILAMRALLDPDQAARLDQYVDRALSNPSR